MKTALVAYFKPGKQHISPEVSMRIYFAFQNTAIIRTSELIVSFTHSELQESKQELWFCFFVCSILFNTRYCNSDFCKCARGYERNNMPF